MYPSISQSGLIGSSYLYLPEAESTNTWCRDLLAGHLPPPEGLVVRAGYQYQGRGQAGNQWLVEPGQNLTFSCILYPRFMAPADQFYLNMAVSLSVFLLLDNYLEQLYIKWPNDILAGDKKIAGILIENSLTGSLLQSSIVGIGININQAIFGELNATSLTQHTGQKHSLEVLLARWCEIFEGLYNRLKKGNYSGVQQEYLKYLWKKDKMVVYYLDGKRTEGTIKGVNNNGQLMIHENGGEKAYNFKEISFVI